MNEIQLSRRRHRRIRVAPNLVANDQFTAVDLSESGIGLACSLRQRAGKRLSLRLSLPNETLTVAGEIAWCREAPSVFEQGYSLGVVFIDLSTKQLLLLREYIDAQ